MKSNTKYKRTLRNRKKLKSVNNGRLRIAVYKSTKNFSAQIIDDSSQKTLVSASSIEKDLKTKKSKKIERSNLLGEILAKRAKEKKSNKVYFSKKNKMKKFLWTATKIKYKFSYLLIKNFINSVVSLLSGFQWGSLFNFKILYLITLFELYFNEILKLYFFLNIFSTFEILIKFLLVKL